jgi:hypothetical protein
MPRPGSSSLCSPESLFGVSSPGGVTIGLTQGRCADWMTPRFLCAAALILGRG